jgi:hemerythrin
MQIQWSPELSTGIEWQDAEHKHIVESMAALLQGMDRHETVSATTRLITFLERYATQHFAHEEAFMLEQEDPSYAVHKAEHEKFAARVHGFQTMFEQKQLSGYMALHLQRWVRAWLHGHITKTDKKMGDWVRKKTTVQQEIS